MTEDFGDIVAGVRAGLPDAWAALYRRFYPTLVGYICKHFRAEVPDAEDLASDVLLLVAQQIKAGDLREAGALYGYIFAVLRNHKNLWMRDRYLGRHFVELKREIPIVLDALSAEEHLIRQEQIQALARMALQLSPRDRELFQRIYVFEETREQIRREMGLTETQLRLYKTRIKIRLMAKLNGLTVTQGGGFRTLGEMRAELAAR
jgi:RNA polymerase sigma factor (sigma-70 family)